MFHMLTKRQKILNLKKLHNLPVSINTCSLTNELITFHSGALNFLEIEYFIISNLIDDNIEYEIINQRLLNVDNLKVDCINVKLGENKFEKYFFDISNVY